VHPERAGQALPIYFTPPLNRAADAVVTKHIGDNRVKLWLGGLDGKTMQAFGRESELVPLDGSNARVTVTDRVKLEAIATVEGSVPVGTLLQEYARAIPRNLTLVIGLDESLGGDRGAIATRLSQNSRIVPVNGENGRYARTVHYIIGQITAANQGQISLPTHAQMPSVGSVGIFSPSLELLPNSFGLPGERPEAMWQRLQPKLKGLLATRVISQTLNAQSSALDVRVTLKLEESQTTILGQAFTFRGNSTAPADPYQLARVPINQPIQLEITNNHSQDLYLAVMVIDVSGDITILFPNEHQNVPDEQLEATTKIPSRQRLLVPDPAKRDFVLVSDELGAGEMLVIASEKPMTDAIKRLRNLARSAGMARGYVPVSNPVDLMSDFALGASRGFAARDRNEFYRMDTDAMAAIAISFEVV
jgi:hypothetical protein